MRGVLEGSNTPGDGGAIRLSGVGSRVSMTVGIGDGEASGPVNGTRRGGGKLVEVDGGVGRDLFCVRCPIPLY